LLAVLGTRGHGPAQRDAGGGAAARAAKLIVNSTPAGARVLLDGGARGSTPLIIADLAPGKELALRLELAGHREQTFVVQLKPGEVRELNHRFEATRARADAAPPPADAGAAKVAHKAKGKGKVTAKAGSKKAEPVAEARHGLLTIASTPWAHVEVDGVKVGVTPLFRHQLRAGRHAVRLHNPERSLTRSFTIEIPADGEVRRKIDLAQP
jgi:hypothetical protein